MNQENRQTRQRVYSNQNDTYKVIKVNENSDFILNWEHRPVAQVG